MRRGSVGAAIAACLLGAALAVPTAGATTTQVDCGAGADLQAAIDAAQPGDTLIVSGICSGGFVIGKDLTLKGDQGDQGEPALYAVYPQVVNRPTLQIAAGAVVKVTGLLIFAHRLVAVVNDGTLTLRDTAVSKTGEHVTVAVHNRGTLTVVDSVWPQRPIALGSIGHDMSALALRNDGTLTMRRSSVFGYSEYGGGIVNTGTATLIDTQVTGATDQIGVGGISNSGTMTLLGSTVSDSNASQGTGGIGNSGTMTLLASVVQGNMGGSFLLGRPGVSGGITNRGTLIIRDSFIKGNAFRPSGTCLVCDGAGIRNDGGTVRIFDSAIRGNIARGDGGGIFNAAGTVRLYRSSVRSNDAGRDGGGIFNAAGAVLRLGKVSIRGNSAERGGGGILSEGTITLFGVTFAFNTPNDCTGC